MKIEAKRYQYDPDPISYTMLILSCISAITSIFGTYEHLKDMKLSKRYKNINFIINRITELRSRITETKKIFNNLNDIIGNRYDKKPFKFGSNNVILKKADFLYVVRQIDSLLNSIKYINKSVRDIILKSDIRFLNSDVLRNKVNDLTSLCNDILFSKLNYKEVKNKVN